MRLTRVRVDRANRVRLRLIHRNIAVAMPEVQLPHERCYELVATRDVILVLGCRLVTNEIAVEVTEHLVPVDVYVLCEAAQNV